MTQTQSGWESSEYMTVDPDGVSQGLVETAGCVERRGFRNPCEKTFHATLFVEFTLYRIRKAFGKITAFFPRGGF